MSQAYLIGANLSGANLFGADLRWTDLTNAILYEADLGGTLLLKTDLRGATLTGSRVYGASVWDIKLNDQTKQQNIVITPDNQAAITVDNIEVAQFIYLLLNNQKIRKVIDTITSKAVLILGRFSEDRKIVLIPSEMSSESIITFRSCSTLTLQPIRPSPRRSRS